MATGTSLQTVDTALTGGASDPNLSLLRMATFTTGTVAVSTAGAVAIRGGGAGAAKADVIVDLLGYYA